jgi:circadian clock protein KaiC
MLSLARYLTEQGATLLISSESSPEAPDEDLQFLSDGVINLGFAIVSRSVIVTKFRGSGFQLGQHSMRLGPGGMQVFPQLVSDRSHREFVTEYLPFGVPELDRILHGGLGRGTVTVLSGPAGVGKTTLGMQFLTEAVRRGERTVLYSFEESGGTLLRRSDGIQMPVRRMVGDGSLKLVEVEPYRYSADEFAMMVRTDVEEQGIRIVMLDSTAGYALSLSVGNLTANLALLCRYLKNMAVTALLINEVESITGEFRATDYGFSYLADNIVFLRYVELSGELRRTLGVLKKRTSDFDKALFEFEITDSGVRVGKTLAATGLLGGVARTVNSQEDSGWDSGRP